MHAGYRVIVPDMLGYRSTDKPANVFVYTTRTLSHDLAAISGLDLVGVEKAITMVIGHYDTLQSTSLFL
jgi:hypothetical protein